MKELFFERDTTWKDIFDAWRECERDWGWEEVWRKRGFESWDAWRMSYVSQLGLQDREWKLYRMTDPFSFFPDIWAGGYAGWKRYVADGVHKIRFRDLVNHPDLSDNGKVLEIMQHPPAETTVILIGFKDQYVVFEGMHRAAAVALASSRGEKFLITVHAVITYVDDRELFERVCTGIKTIGAYSSVG